jgi:hypothetical protein
MLGWLAGNADSLIARAAGGIQSLTTGRSYEEFNLYALRPLAMLVPPVDHRWSRFGTWGEAFFKGTAAGNEANHAYLGLIGIAGLACIICFSAVRAIRSPRSGLPFQFWQLAWILAFSVAGGAGAALALAGLTMFRASNRYSIAVLALALLMLGQVLTAATRRWPSWARVAVAAVLCMVAAWDQLPRFKADSAIAALENRMASDRVFVHTLEQELRPGAMVFQLPIMPFPESRPVRRVGSYDHLRPYLHSSGLRWSFGDHRSNATARSQLSLEGVAVPELIARLEAARFAALLVDTDGYRDGGEALLRDFREAGLPMIATSAEGDLVAFSLPHYDE